MSNRNRVEDLKKFLGTKKVSLKYLWLISTKNNETMATIGGLVSALFLLLGAFFLGMFVGGRNADKLKEE